MKKLLVLIGLLFASPAFAADNTVIVTPGTGVTMRSKDVGAGVESMIHILGDTGGNPIYGTAGTANANILTVQGIASMTPFLTTTTLNAETTKVIGTVRSVGNVGGVFDAIGQNVAAPANWLQIGCQFQTTPTTITAANGSPFQCDNAANALVNVKVSALPSGASTSALQPTNAAQGSTTSGQTGHLVECAVTSAAPTYTTAQTNPLSCDTAGNTRVTVTNTNANGQTTMSASSPVVIASNQSQVPVDAIVTPSNSFTRPANTTAYASGQLVANSTTAGSVVPLSWTSAARVSGGNFYIRRVRMTLSSKSVTLTSFRIHFYTVTPTIANGDGAAWSTTLANYVCKMDVPVASWVAGTDVSIGFGLPTSGDGNECNVVASTQTLFALVEARAAYVPASGETVTVIPEIHQN